MSGTWLGATNLTTTKADHRSKHNSYKKKNYFLDTLGPRQRNKSSFLFILIFLRIREQAKHHGVKDSDRECEKGTCQVELLSSLNHVQAREKQGRKRKLSWKPSLVNWKNSRFSFFFQKKNNVVVELVGTLEMMRSNKWDPTRVSFSSNHCVRSDQRFKMIWLLEEGETREMRHVTWQDTKTFPPLRSV